MIMKSSFSHCDLKSPTHGRHLRLAAHASLPYLGLNQETQIIDRGVNYEIVNMLLDKLMVSRKWHYESTWLVQDDKRRIIGGSVGKVIPLQSYMIAKARPLINTGSTKAV